MEKVKWFVIVAMVQVAIHGRNHHVGDAREKDLSVVEHAMAADTSNYH